MHTSTSKTVTHYQKRRRWNRTWKRITTVLASVVVFITTYALILPAITMEPEYICGKEAHVHTDACYQLAEPAQMSNLICTFDTLGIHTHTTECYNENSELMCGYADFVLHTHSSHCYNQNGELTCVLPEIEAHIHDERCWKQPHAHTDACYLQQRGELLCTVEEGSVHTHLDTCYTPQQNLVCTVPETAPHTHSTETCYAETKDLLCTEPEVAAHIHSDTCYTAAQTLTCTLEELEGHAHSDACYDENGTLICGLPEIVGHKHDDACYQSTTTFSCTLEETAGHTHVDTCYSTPVSTLICTTEETEGHMHGTDCFETVGVVTCALEENVPHAHTDACFLCTPVLQCTELTAEEGAAPVLSCQKEERVLHIHAASCLDASGVYSCGKPELYEHIHEDACFVETVGSSEELVLICGYDAHEHTEGCLPPEEDSTDMTLPEEETLIDGLYCGYVEHMHLDSCFHEDGLLLCTMSEHEHNWICALMPSDPSAAETADDWEADLPELSGIIADDLIAVAESQLGYEQIEENYIIEGEELLYYSRYADWWSYGTDPYGDWNAKFVAFCLNYAGVTDVPLEPTIADWPDALAYYGQWRENDGMSLPISADLVFLDIDGNEEADHAGIITDVDLESSQMTLILERNGKVCQREYDLVAPDILGYARIPGNFADVGPVQEGWIPVIPPDVSEGPVFYISAVYTPQPEVYSPYTLRRDSIALFSTPTDIKAYLNTNGGNYFFTLLNSDNTPLTKDENGHYIVTTDTKYKLSLSINSPNGIAAPGTYTYQLPAGLTVVGGSGEFTLGEDNEVVGTWDIDENGLITMVFNANMNNRTEVTITASMEVRFSHTNEPIKFDGKVTVMIEKPPEDNSGVQLNKWGQQGDGSTDRPDPGKIYWTIEILGNENSQIPGSTVTDILTSGEHSFTESDREYGLIFMASQRDPITGAEVPGGWHQWIVPATDITWNTDNPGWSYTIPETVTCRYCGELELGNEHWYYWIKYSTTPNETTINGSRYYENTVHFENQTAVNGTSIQHGDPGTVDVAKKGVFQGNAAGGKFLWEVQVTIPGLEEGDKGDYYWYFQDTMDVVKADGWSTVDYLENTIHLSSVKALYNNQVIDVPRIQDATDEDLFAWHIDWDKQDKPDVSNVKQVVLLCRCQCTPENCQHVQDGNDKYWYTLDWNNDGAPWFESDFCKYWTMEQDTTFILSYETSDVSVLERYGGTGNQLRNTAALYKKVPGSAWDQYTPVGNTSAVVPIPGVFKKELTQDYNGYTANYTITVNEAKLQLTNGTPMTIHDMMSETLAYISGSLVITTEDKDGNIGNLTQGTDYTVTYDGSGAQHILDIVILDPQPVMYTLNYDATLIIPSSPDAGVTYSNSATIELWGKDLTVDSTEKIYAELNISAKNYKVEVKKTDSGTGACLPGASFGLYNQQGGLITSGTTDENGYLLFQTNVTQGIILREHTPYYVQEIAAPPGYALEDTKHWFLFCEEKDSTGNYKTECTYQSGIEDIKKIPGDKIGVFDLTNQQNWYELPSTGGAGTTAYRLLGGGMLLLPILLITKKRKNT